MKKILAILLFSFMLSAHAKGFFVGGDLGVATYPDFTSDVTNWLISSGATSYGTAQTLASGAVDIHGGQWVNDNLGWEVGYTNMGGVDGSFQGTGVLYSAYGDYKYKASAIHAVALGGIPFGRSKLYGKAGIYLASTKLSGNITINGTPYPLSDSRANFGLLVGAGYEFSFGDHFSMRAGLNLFGGVKYANVWSGAVEGKNMVQAAVGGNYVF